MVRIARRCIRYFMYDMKMYNKFVLIYFVFTIFPFLIFSLLAIRALSREMFRLETSSAQAVVEQADALLCNQLQSIIEETYTIYLDNELYEYLSAEHTGDNRYQTLRIEEKLSTIVESGKALNAFLYLEDAGKISRQHYRCQSLESAKSMAWYQALKKRDRKSLWYFSDVNGYHVRSIYSKYDGSRLVGYIVITFPKNIVLDVLDDMHITENSEAFITDGENEIAVFSQNNRDSAETVHVLASSEKIHKGSYDVARGGRDGNSYFLVQEKIENKQLSGMPDWTLFIAVPYGELTRITNEMLCVLVAAALFCIVLICFATARIIRSITKRIDKLNKNMQRPQMGDFSVNDTAPGCDEISGLRRNFNYMLDKIAQLMDEKAKADEHQKDMELGMLQAQINPHFLYNTLDMINWASISHQPQEIPVITSMLAKFYKLSLNRGDRIVRLADEIEHVRLYIGIQNKRYDSALTFTERVPEELLDCACLKILLQPIVENAVLHGILEKDIPEGEIVLTACRAGGETLRIEILDNGVGMGQECLDRLKRSDSGLESVGYGLANIEERIKLCYGDRYGLEFESEEGSYTRVIIKIRYVKYDSSLKMSTKLQEGV